MALLESKLFLATIITGQRDITTGNVLITMEIARKQLRARTMDIKFFASSLPLTVANINMVLLISTRSMLKFCKRFFLLSISINFSAIYLFIYDRSWARTSVFRSATKGRSPENNKDFSHKVTNKFDKSENSCRKQLLWVECQSFLGIRLKR